MSEQPPAVLARQRPDILSVATAYNMQNYMPVPESGCWLWLGGTTPNGYGRASTARAHVVAHRVFYAYHKGPIPDGLQVCHKCDTRLCVNPDHLFLGTQSDNANDMYRKGRGNDCFGERNGIAKLTEAQVLEILASPDLSGAAFARRYGVHPTTIHRARRGEYWKHLNTAALQPAATSEGEKS